VADWGGGMSSGCKPRVQLLTDAAQDGRIVRCGVSLAHANQPPLPRS